MKTGILSLITVVLVFSSCVQGFDDEWTFTSDVENTTLESPKAETVVFTPSANGRSLRIDWSVVHGAGGYQFSLYIVDDPDNPVVVGVENEIIDRCYITRDLLPDTKYKVVLKTMGNEKYNNQAATSATEVNYSTLLPATLIPDGIDLYQYFIDNPIVDNGEEIGFELEAGGNYTVSAEINFGKANVTLRGDKIERASVVMSAGIKSQGGGSKIKFINFDCAGIPASSAFYGFTDIPEGNVLVNDAVKVTNPVVFLSCNFSALPAPLYWDNGKNYAVQTLLIEDCLAEMTNNGRVIWNSASRGSLKDFEITNSTFYKNNAGTDFWMQLSTGSRIVAFGWVEGNFTYANCTFYGFDRMHNSNQYAQAYIKTTVQNCLFLDMLRDQTARYILPGSRLYSEPAIKFGNNTYWRVGAVENYGSYDKSGTTLDEDPLCVNPAGGDFTLGNQTTVSRAIGDPRWF